MDIEFPDEYKFWLNHEIERVQNPLFKNIPENKRLEVWKKIEEGYLKKYKRFIRIAFDWGSSAIWAPPFPGSIASGPMWSIETFYQLPEAVIQRHNKWLEYRDTHSLESGTFDFESSDKEGREIALQIREFIPEHYYLEFESTFKEIKLQNGKPIELDIPDFLKPYQ